MSDDESRNQRGLRQEAEQDQRTAERERDEATQREHVNKIVDVLHGHKRWLRNAAIVAVLAILASGIDSHMQRNAMQRQLDEMQAEQRAWISVSTFQPTMAVDANQITIGIQYTAHNSGHKPATGGVAGTSLMAVPTKNGFHGDKSSSRETCKKADATAGGGFTIFPGDSPLLRTEVAIPLAWLKDAPADPKNGGARVIHVFIQFCIGYKEVGNAKTIHHTPYSLRLVDLSHGGGSLEFTGQAVPPDQLQFVQFPIFDNQAD